MSVGKSLTRKKHLWITMSLSKNSTSLSKIQQNMDTESIFVCVVCNVAAVRIYIWQTKKLTTSQ